jgi:cytochrome P450
VAYAEAMGDRWRHGQSVDIYSEMMRLSLEIVCKCLFSAEVGGLTTQVQRAMADILPFVDRIVEVTGILKMFLPTPTNLRFWRARRYLNRLIYDIIRERREKRSDCGDLLSMLLLAQEEVSGQELTDKQVRDEVMTLFVAGHETSATALAWTWYVLATRPDIAARVQEEVDAALDGCKPAIAHVGRLPYTRMVILETLRLYSPIYLYDRSPSRDTALGGYRIKKGAIIFLSPYAMHRHPRYYPDPERFDPDRWLPEEADKRPKYAYFPFGGGPRTCIGEQFAWAEIVLILAVLLRRWNVALAPDQPIVMEPLITMRPKHGIRIVTSARARQP